MSARLIIRVGVTCLVAAFASAATSLDAAREPPLVALGITLVVGSAGWALNANTQPPLAAWHRQIDDPRGLVPGAGLIGVGLAGGAFSAPYLTWLVAAGVALGLVTVGVYHRRPRRGAAAGVRER